jgi:hypothetical protein
MLPALVALALAAEPIPAPAVAPAGSVPARPARTVAGKISAVVPAESRLTLEAADGPLRLAFDRNTMVFLEARMGTPRDLLPGLPARAAVGPGGLAFWIELRPRGVVPTSRDGEAGPEAAPPAAASLAPPTAAARPTADPAAAEGGPGSR